MAQTFTRVTFTGPAGRADMSVPDDLPVALVLRQVSDLLGTPAEAPLVITHPVMGDLAPEATLRDAGILDGDLLYLRQPGDRYQPPYVEDVADEVAGAEGTFWSPGATRMALTAAAAAWLGLTGPAILWRFGAEEATPMLAVVFAALLGGAVGGWLMRQHDLTMAFGWALAPAAGSLAGAVGSTQGAAPELMTAAVAGAVGVALGLTGMLLTEQQREFVWTVLLGTVVTAVALVVWGDLAAVGLPGDRAAAVVGVALLAAQSPLPRVAVQLTGLARLADAAAEGEPVRREQVRPAARQSRSVLSGLLTGFSVPVVIMIAVLAPGGGWQRGLGVLLATALLLRARRYSRPAHVLPLVVCGLVGLTAVAVGVLLEGGVDAPSATVAALAGGLLFIGASLVRLAPATQARMRIGLDRVETIVLLAAGIALFGVFNAFAWAYSVVR